MDKTESQGKEFNAVDIFIKAVKVAGDSYTEIRHYYYNYPERRHYYERAVRELILAFEQNGRLKFVSNELTFSKLRDANTKRAAEVFKMCEDWWISDWFMALIGECGELGNLLKKANRGEYVDRQDISDELADIQIYLDLLASKLHIHLDKAVIKKFNEVSAKRNSIVTL